MSWFSKLLSRSRNSNKNPIPQPNRCRLALPKDWHPGNSTSSTAGHMEFYGSDGSAIKFAIGPISPEPTPQQQKDTLTSIAKKQGHTVLSTGEIAVGGTKHATMTCEVPRVGVLRNYSLIFDGWEYFATAKGNLELCDTIIKTFVVTTD